MDARGMAPRCHSTQLGGLQRHGQCRPPQTRLTGPSMAKGPAGSFTAPIAGIGSTHRIEHGSKGHGPELLLDPRGRAAGAWPMRPARDTIDPHNRHISPPSAPPGRPCTDAARPCYASRTPRTRPRRTALSWACSPHDPRRVHSLPGPQGPHVDSYTDSKHHCERTAARRWLRDWKSTCHWLFPVTYVRTAQTGAPLEGPSNGRSRGRE